MDPEQTESHQPPLGPTVPALELDLFGGLTEEEFEIVQDELRRGCGWG